MTLEELNLSILDESVGELIRIAEAKQVKALSKIADVVCGRPGIRLVLLAGGSSAGKTTTAKRLCTQLRVNDRPALLLSTDDYFVGDARNPRDENGKLDYEHVACVDSEQLAADVNALFAGEDIVQRRFDFLRHRPGDTGKRISLPKGGFVVIEGIHALNPILSAGIDDTTKFRVFVNPNPSLDVFGGFAPTSEESRFIRRMVRDYHFRKMSPAKTVEMWPNVLAGEAKWIRPFVSEADATFDSYLNYELPVLKPYVGGLLERARREVGENAWVEKTISLLRTVVPMSAEKVPGDSIIRETIGGSQLEY